MTTTLDNIGVLIETHEPLESGTSIRLARARGGVAVMR